MGILDNKISQDDIQRVSDVRHHPQYESGFGGDSLFGSDGDNDMDDFGSLDDLFGDSGDSGFGGGNTGFGGGTSGFGGSSNGFGGGSTFGGNNGFGNNSGFGGDTGFGGGSTFGGGFGNSGGFGNNGFGNNGFGNNGFGNSGGFGNNGFGNNIPQQNNNVQQKDTMDKIFDTGAVAVEGIGQILLEMIKSFKDRSADDYGYLSTNLIKTGAVITVSGLIFGIVGSLMDIRILSFSGLALHSMLGGALSLTTGIMGMGIAGLVLCKLGEQELPDINNIPDEPAGEDNFTNEYEDNSGDILDDLFGDDFDDIFNDNDNDWDNIKEEEPVVADEIDIEPDPINYAEKLEEVNENMYLSRQTLFNTFLGLFPFNTPKFADVKELEVDSKDWKTLEAICIKSLANLANCTIEEVDSSMEYASETLFAYEVRLKRIKKVKQPELLANEIEIYMKSDENPDVSVTATLDGDFYKIIITKGESKVVTFGDIFKQEYCKDFFLDDKHKLPMISGINSLGKVILDDAKIFDTMMICGKPRSGKSWYVLSILMSLMLFNSPEEIQFIIVDPKKSNLFKTLALLPHVAGLHDDSNILSILDDIIEIEAERRKRLLSENRCDDIWALKKKGITLPVLYIVIDEYMTVTGNLANDKDKLKEFDTKIRVLISQLPSQGIRLIFVPHRTTSVVDKTNRTMLQFTAAVRSDINEVKEALGISKWDKALTKPGDIALKTASSQNAMYVRGAALTTDDGENSEFIETAAKIFYKMGVEIPDMSAMKVACNRDENYVMNELGVKGNRIQYNASTILQDIENEDFSNLF